MHTSRSSQRQRDVCMMVHCEHAFALCHATLVTLARTHSLLPTRATHARRRLSRVLCPSLHCCLIIIELMHAVRCPVLHACIGACQPCKFNQRTRHLSFTPSCRWRTNNDPVMGGRSYSTVAIENGLLNFTGSVRAQVPILFSLWISSRPVLQSARAIERSASLSCTAAAEGTSPMRPHGCWAYV